MITLAGTRDQLRENITFEVGKGIGVAKELCHIDEKGFYQLANFLWIGPQVLQVVPHGAVVCHGHTATDAPQDGRSFIRAKVDVGLATDLLKDAVQHISRPLFRLWQGCTCEQIVQQGTDAFYRRFEIDHCRWQG